MNAQGRKHNSLSLLQFPSLEPCKGRNRITPSLIILDCLSWRWKQCASPNFCYYLPVNKL